MVLDIGSAFITAVYRGVLFRERTLAIVRRNPTLLVAFGREAEIRSNRLERGTFLVRPVSEGVIRDAQVLELVIQAVVKKVTGGERVASLPAKILVHSSIAPADKNAYLTLAKLAGLRQAEVVEAMQVVAKMAQADDPEGSVLAVNMGAGLTEIALLAGGKVHASCALNLGGNAVDAGLAEIIATNYNLRISSEVAERFKKSAGSLYAGDNASAEVVGIDILDGTVKGARIVSADVDRVVRDAFGRIVAQIAHFIEDIQSEEVAFPKKILLFGGLTRLTGVASFFAENTRIPTEIPRNPEAVVALYATKGR